eukprot:1529465-Pyramimonas_sp.AAC.1
MQATAYVTRLQNTTLAAIRALQLTAFDNRTIEPGTVSMHLRFGDKIRESNTTSEERYLTLVNSFTANFSAFFVSTEDQLALDRVRHSLNRPVWFVNVSRTATRGASGLTLTEIARNSNPSNMFVDAWLNMLMAIQCDAYIGTLSSSWNRMLDSLRSTVGCKAQAPYYDPTSRLQWFARHPTMWNVGGEFFWGNGTHVLD